MVFGVAQFLGKSECGTATANNELRLRLLTPVVKALKGFSAGKAVAALEECIVSFGGQGYTEENRAVSFETRHYQQRQKG